MEMLSAGSGARLNKDKSRKSWSLLPYHSQTPASCLEVGLGGIWTISRMVMDDAETQSMQKVRVMEMSG